MKKNIVLLMLPILTLSFMTCSFEIPNAVQIKGSPNVTLAADFPIGSTFAENLDDLFLQAINESEYDLEPVNCTNTVYQTYLIYTELLSENFDLSNIGVDFPEDISQEFLDFLASLGIQIEQSAAEYELEEDKILLDSTMELPLSDMGDILEGFVFDMAEVILYISGVGGLAELLTVELAIGDGESHIIPVSESKPSDIDDWRNGGYNGRYAPESNIEFPMSDITLGEDVIIRYKVYIKEGTTITPESLLLDATIKAEAVIWLPLILKAGEGGRAINFSEFLGDLIPDKDLFDRKYPGDDLALDEIVDSATLKIVLDNNPFRGAELVIRSANFNTEDNIVFKNELTGNSLDFNISDDLLERINRPVNWPFIPDISIFFAEGETISIPRNFNFNITQFNFSAKVNYLFKL
ncbi:MAG: hypothetical protein FWD40_03130 [Treponema sp.]|nr:hypothetical protein [Treponema sp.]